MKKLLVALVFLIPSIASAQTPPTVLTVTVKAQTVFALDWQDIDFEERYLVERRVGRGGTWQGLAETRPGVKYWEDHDPNLDPTTEYGYRIRARILNRYSGPSDIVYAKLNTDDVTEIPPDPNDNLVGVGISALAFRAEQCLPQMGWWTTDELRLYKCVEINLWAGYYTPYRYPAIQE